MLREYREDAEVRGEFSGVSGANLAFSTDCSSGGSLVPKWLNLNHLNALRIESNRYGARISGNADYQIYDEGFT
jgi:hypothetical protein